MRVGEVVMFVDKGRYAKWFFGKLAIVENSTPKKKSCRVRWLDGPIKYGDKYTRVSDFHWKNFEGYQNEDR